MLAEHKPGRDTEPGAQKALPWAGKMIFLSVLAGTFLGNLGVLWVIGAMAKRAEKKQLEELKRLQQGYLDMAQRERTRLENYARMEG